MNDLHVELGKLDNVLAICKDLKEVHLHPKLRARGYKFEEGGFRLHVNLTSVQDFKK